MKLLHKIFLPALLMICNTYLSANDFFLAGNETGLYEIDNFKIEKIWDGGKVIKISKAANRWLFLTDNGIAYSNNLKDFKYINGNLPKKIIKTINENGNKIFTEKISRLKDLEVHPINPNIYVTASSSKVFLTLNAGKTWQDLGANGFMNGIKAVSVLDLPDDTGKRRLTVFVSHALYGIAWIQPEVNSKIWYELNDGLGKGPEVIDEVSDISVIRSENFPELYCCQSFSGDIFRLNWKKKQFEKIISLVKNSPLVYTDSISIEGKTIIGVQNGNIFDINLMTPNIKKYAPKTLFKNFKRVKNILQNSNYLCAFIPEKMMPFNNGIALSELWLLHNKKKTEMLEKADRKKGIYIPIHHVRNEKKLNEHLNTIKKYNLNAIVIDMKDEAGIVRYNSKNADIQKYNGIRNPINLEKLIKKAKAENIYIIARIVAFKDKNLYSYANGKYAVKDKNTGKPWQGYKFYDGEKTLVQEHWVDPYNEDVWKYNADIAEELYLNGVDEIQFDYIRFPTDGENLGSALYQAKEKGMDKESAIMSFLAYTRKRIKAPISIDIYGSNGWYRTGARTGQDVELLSEYVDVICPMFYPSHFAQTFLAYKPAEERPYRIYREGTWRNKMIARNKVIVRAWAQAFYLNVSYDKKYYNQDYVKRQIIGVKDSINEGYIYWNISGKYGDIRPDGEGL